MATTIARLGRHQPALAVGAEVHWICGRYEQQSRDLLVEAYRQLGREALAQIAGAWTAVNTDIGDAPSNGRHAR
jgi:hypothetical protein